MPRRKENLCNQSWDKDEVLKHIKRSATEALSEVKKREVGHTVIFVPHPTLPRTMIQKII